MSSVMCGLVPGKYFIGDILSSMFDIPTEVGNGKCGVYETDDGLMYAFDATASSGGGTGTYYDSDGYTYIVMSHYVGIVPWELCKYNSSPAPNVPWAPGGRIIESTGPIIFTARHGLFKVHMTGKAIEIDTRSPTSSTYVSPRHSHSQYGEFDDLDGLLDYD
jgi:hypothetical protein